MGRSLRPALGIDLVRIGELAHAFGMNVLVLSRSHSVSPLYQPFAWAGVDEVFHHSDVISLHCPLIPETAGLVNRKRLQRVRHDAFLINTSRGGLVEEQDLAEALNYGRLAGAAVDVVSCEPIRPDHPLLSARNCLITPHIAWATREARFRLLAATVANVANFLAGRDDSLWGKPLRWHPRGVRIKRWCRSRGPGEGHPEKIS